jgi:CMP-N-acetylneuraminic acid synthetase
MKSNILAVILARAGSKGVPKKNLLELGGISLLGHAIRSANQCRHRMRIIVSTESDEIKAEALKHNANVPFKRPSNLADDTSSTWDVMRHAVTWFEENENWFTDILVVLQPTTPFRTGKHIDSVLEKMEKTNSSVCMTVKQTNYPPQWMYHCDDNGILSPLLQGVRPKRRQDSKPIYQPNGMVYALKRHRLDEDEPMLADDTQSIIIDSDISINIDDPRDYDLAKLAWKKLNDS